MDIEFRKFTDYNRDIIYDILKGAYSFDERCAICWDPRNRPEYVEIGHNGIRAKYKGKGFGKFQLSEAVRRIKEYDGLKQIRVCTNSNLIAWKNYESVGFVLYDKKENNDGVAFSGDYLYYKIQLQEYKESGVNFQFDEDKFRLLELNNEYLRRYNNGRDFYRKDASFLCLLRNF